jgi:hypothetical protein
MKTMDDGGIGKTSLPRYVDRGIGSTRAGAMLSVSILLHVSAVVLVGLVKFGPVVTEVAAPAGDSSQIDLVEIEPEPAVEPPIDIVMDIAPSPPTEFIEAIPDRTPNRVDMPQTIAAAHPPQRSALRPRGILKAPRGGALTQTGNSSNGWSTPKPAYPFEARRLRRQGSGGVHVTTNGIGRVVNAAMQPGIDPLLDAVAVSFARSAWTGPPNCTRVVAITFSLE